MIQRAFRLWQRRGWAWALLPWAGAWAGAIAAAAEPSFLPGSAPFIGREALIPMRDGAELAADVYLPRTAGRFPVILVQTPYNKAASRAWFDGTGRVDRGPLFSDTHYAFVVTDWRGHAASAGADRPGVVSGRGQDGFDTLEWIVAQPWCDGKIGTWGPSALGGVQYRTAAERHPHHVCAVPIVMPLNLEYEIYFPGGALFEEFALRLKDLGWDRISWLREHPMKDEFWGRLAETTFIRPQQIEIPMLFIGGWYDIYTDGVIRAFEQVRAGGGEKARRHSKLIMGPWVHRTDEAQNGALTYAAAAGFGGRKTLAFFDYWLRGVDNDFDAAEPSITYYQMGSEQWRSSATWPPGAARPQAWHLRAGGKLASEPAPPGGPASSTFRHDPARPVPTVGGHVLTQGLLPGPQDQREKVESRRDLLVFTTDSLEADLSIAGRPVVDLFVSSDRPDTDFAAILTDVHPDGRSMLVTEGLLRMRFREGFDRETFMRPETVYRITIELTNTAITFLQGHRVRLIVASSNHPKYAVNPNDGGPLYDGGAGQPALNVVHHDGSRPSALLLPVLNP